MNKRPEAVYYTEKNGRFVIENYNWSKSFASFFPGIAGKTGVPMWGYYVNRAQGVCSIGVRNKDHQIMEFLSFNRAVQLVGNQGFRSFIRIEENIYEPFSRTQSEEIKQKMTVSAHELEIEEENPNSGINTNLVYFQLPSERIPSLVRVLTLTNSSSKEKSIELVDGLPRIFPYGTTREDIKTTPRHIEGIMQVYEPDSFPLFRLKIDPADKPEIELLDGSNFFFSFGEDDKLLKEGYIVDPAVLFGSSKNYDEPLVFAESGLKEVLSRAQIKKNKTPSAFIGRKVTLKPGESFTLRSYIGYAPDEKALAAFLRRVEKKNYTQNKREDNRRIISEIKDNMFTLSGSDNFDEYCGQTFLDNAIRGGLPSVVETAYGPNAFYLFSRQNGDLERDYHDFVIEPTYYSQGNGHYRCVIQNRRMDNFFLPDIGESNIRFFLNAMQTDGYNTIEVRSTTFTVVDKSGFNDWLDSTSLEGEEKKKASSFSKKAFMPGDAAMLLEDLGISDPRKKLEELLRCCRQNIVIDLHPRLGYWLDHWCYNMDLLKSYLRLFPENFSKLFSSREYIFYDSPDRVLPRDKKYILVDGKVRQYEAVERDLEHLKTINSRPDEPNALRDEYGRGEVYKTNLTVKLLTLIVNRIATLDPFTAGYEMEANKPGWNDSINGLPGIMGSSLCHAFQLNRFCRFLKRAITEGRVEKETDIFRELHELMEALLPLLDERLSDSSDKGRFHFWDKSHSLKEEYRKKTSTGISGREKKVKVEFISEFLDKCISLLDSVASEEDIFSPEGVPYTYFINEAEEWEETGEKDALGRPFVRVKRFSRRPVTPFLEGAVHFLKVYPERASEIYSNIKKSQLFDKKLKSYRNNESLEDESFEIGRIKAWGRGWIENESFYTHMLFKYLLEVLKSGLYDEFFRDIKGSLMPFMDPKVYGRSIFENVSFVVSSAFVDESMHGQGLQGRLSGSTCEFIHMWSIMTVGEKPFFNTDEGGVGFRLKPVLPGWFFSETEKKKKVIINGNETEVKISQGDLAFLFLGRTVVVYHNPKKKNTYGPDSARIRGYLLEFNDGSTLKVDSHAVIDSAEDIRNGLVRRIDAYLE